MILTRITLITVLAFLVACGNLPALDEVIPDRRTEYRKSESLPDLEVPPDLTTEGLEDPLSIPNEEATTLSEFERQKTRRRLGAPLGAATAGATADDNWVLVQASKKEYWPALRSFWQEQGYELELDDPELGVMETQWKETGSSDVSVVRTRFTLFTEEGTTPGTTMLLISSDQQERIANNDGSGEWLDITGDESTVRNMVADLNQYFYGAPSPGSESSVAAASPSTTTDTAVSAQAKAEVLDLGDNKLYLSLPEEFTRAWTLTEAALLKAGLLIEKQDRSKGLYHVLYFSPEDREEGLLDKLKFWGDDDGTPYQISLTGVGDKTELVVLDKDGEWEKGVNANRILSLLQAQYNNQR